jgi:hypothetical protein
VLVITLETDIVVKLALEGVPEPIIPGELNVLPLMELALRFETFVELETVKGAVPVETVLAITAEALRVVNAPLPGELLPILPGFEKVAPFKVDALRFGTFVVLETINGGVPVEIVLFNCPPK